MKKISLSPQDTYDIAFALGQKAAFGFRDALASVFTLQGELGAGKTTFAQGFAAGLGVEEMVLSPTFVIIKSYPVPSTKRTLHHIDCYRIEGARDLEDLGWKDMVWNPLDIMLLEWPEKGGGLLDIPKTEIMLRSTGQKTREVIIEYS